MWGPALGADMTNFWSVWSLFPRSFGPNAVLLATLYQAGMGRLAGSPNADAERQLARESYAKGGGFRFFDKLARHGDEAVLPFRPIDTGHTRPTYARPGASRPQYARPSYRR
jgi:hypothetical protein